MTPRTYWARLVIPAKAGIQEGHEPRRNLDSRLRGNDAVGLHNLLVSYEKSLSRCRWAFAGMPICFAGIASVSVSVVTLPHGMLPMDNHRTRGRQTGISRETTDRE
jgi:hypothetical protein